MGTEEVIESPRARKRNPFRRRHHHSHQRDIGSSEHGSDEAMNNDLQKKQRKLQWSPGIGHKIEEANGEAAHERRRRPSLDETKNMALHFSAGLGHHLKKHRSYSDVLHESSMPGRSRRRLPSSQGSSPRPQSVDEDRKKFAWQDSLSDYSDDDANHVRTVAQRLHRIRRKLNPRAKKAHWRYRIGGRIHEEEEEEAEADEMPMDELDPLEGFLTALPRNGHSLAGELEVPERVDWIPDQRHSSSADALDLATHSSDDIFRYSPLSEPNTSPRQIRGLSYDVDAISLTASHLSSGTSIYHSGSSGALPEVKSMRKQFKSEAKEFRVKPFHCFAPDVVYMTEAEIHQSMIKPSTKVEFLESYVAPSSMKTKKMNICADTERLWGNTSDGRIGSLRVEVLSCIGLASVKPDVAVYLICGDVPFVTDTLNSCRSPMWPPNSKRAAVFPIHHAYARLFAGVFATKKERNDEFCGRVVLDLSALRPNTEYDVTLPLRASSFIYDRRPRGVIRLRFGLHWFNERAAVLSYLNSPQCLVVTQCQESPSILCGDPKTFRNVAITVHGQDLPGKYTRKAFQATMREFNLSRLNLIFLAKTLATDAVMYEKPLVSLYIFVAWMHCVYSESVRLAPVYFVGYLIFNLFDNYERYNECQAYHLGYAPLTLQELLYALFLPSGDGKKMHPIVVTKKAVTQNQNNKTKLSERHFGSTLSELSEDGGTAEIEPLNHREFPFSEKHEYPMFRAEEAIVPRKHASGSTANAVSSDQYLYGHLSVYTGDNTETLQSLPAKGGEDDDWEFSDNEEMDMNDSDDIRGDGDSVFTESDVDEDEHDEGIHQIAGISTVRRIPLGPPQNTDVKPLKRVPPQVILARAENMLQRLTFGLSMDKVFHSTLSVGRRNNLTSVQDTPSQDVTEHYRRSRKRTPLDEYDKRLGLRTRSKNPVVGITASFLGPLMRMFRIFVVAVRVVFNIGVWKDPFLSFWALCFLIALMLILIIFPWRAFMFVVGLLCFGPQNILVRRRFFRHATEEEKEQEQEQAEKDEISNTSHSLDSGRDSDDSGSSPGTTTPEESSSQKDEPAPKRGPRRRLKNKLAQMKERRRLRKQDSSVSASSGKEPMSRPPFSAARHLKASKVPLEPREVIVPYTRIRTERFYDWPPDPTASRATPFELENSVVEEIPIPTASRDASPQRVRRRGYSETAASLQYR